MLLVVLICTVLFFLCRYAMHWSADMTWMHVFDTWHLTTFCHTVTTLFTLFPSPGRLTVPKGHGALSHTRSPTGRHSDRQLCCMCVFAVDTNKTLYCLAALYDTTFNGMTSWWCRHTVQAGTAPDDRVAWWLPSSNHAIKHTTRKWHLVHTVQRQSRLDDEWTNISHWPHAVHSSRVLCHSTCDFN